MSVTNETRLNQTNETSWFFYCGKIASVHREKPFAPIACCNAESRPRSRARRRSRIVGKTLCNDSTMAVKISAAATCDGGPARLAPHGADSQYRFYRLTSWHFSC